MKSIRFSLLYGVAMAIFTVAFAQSAAHSATQKTTDTQKPTEAQKSFAQLKTLAGSWEGSVTVDPAQPQMDTGKPIHVSLRTTSRGNTLVHEMQEAGTPLDSTKYEHPVTMLYLDGDHLTLIHYCDAGNRPRMVARTSEDCKKVEFDFADVSGATQYGHMHHAVFTSIDANHHTEDWTYMLPGDKPLHAHFDLARVKDGSSVSGN